MRTTIIAVCAFVIVSSIGCAANNTLPPTPNGLTGTSIDRAHTHVDSAESANQRIVPHADKTGQEISKIVSDEHAKADQALDQAKAENAAQARQLAGQQKQLAASQAQVHQLQAEWGHRLEVFVKAFTTILIVLLAVHVLAGGLAVVLPAFFPAAIVAVPVLKIVGAVCNPAGWVQFAYDHLHPCNCPKITITKVG